MSIWTRIYDILSQLAAGLPLSQVFEKLRTPPERTVGFAIAVMALGAKMAKVDGTVNRTEVRAFREIFHIKKEDEQKAAMVFDLARKDAAGYEIYAKKIKKMFGDDMPILEELFAGLFHIAVSDGNYHPLEDLFLGRVAQIFGISEQCFRALRARYVPSAEGDPYHILGVTSDMTIKQIRTAWRAIARDQHPDKLVARGLPEEAIKLAQTHLAMVNRAWETIQEHHGTDSA